MRVDHNKPEFTTSLESHLREAMDRPALRALVISMDALPLASTRFGSKIKHRSSLSVGSRCRSERAVMVHQALPFAGCLCCGT